MAYLLTVRDVDADVHSIRATDKGEVLQWMAKFLDDLEDRGMSAVNIQVINDSEGKP